MLVFSELFAERRFYFLCKSLYFIDNEHNEVATCGSRRLYTLKPMLDHLSGRFQSVYTPQCEVSMNEALMWNV